MNAPAVADPVLASQKVSAALDRLTFSTTKSADKPASPRSSVMNSRRFDNLVGAGEQGRRYVEAALAVFKLSANSNLVGLHHR